MLVLATWVFTVLSRLYVGGQSDRRTFHCLVYTAAGGILYVVALLILSPALSDYLVFQPSCSLSPCSYSGISAKPYLASILACKLPSLRS
jgi:hypothetical protein